MQLHPAHISIHNMKLALIALFSPLLLSALPAATVVYPDLLAWESASFGNVITTERFEGLAVHVITDGENVSTASGVSILGMGAGGLAIVGFSSGDFDSGFINADFEDRTTKLVFMFPSPVSGFGFDYVGANDPGSIWISLATGNEFGTDPNTPINAPKFIGVTSDQPISWFSLATDSFDQDYSIDNLRFTSIPEPATVGFMAFLTGILTLRRTTARRRYQTMVAC